jgi:Flp pilus assembly protein TadD
MDAVRSEQLLAQAIQQYQSGRLLDAESIVGQILRENPDHAPALNISALVAHATGSLPLAFSLIRRALQVSPDNALFHNNLGMIQFSSDQREECIVSFTKAIDLQPDLVEAHNNMGTVLRMQGDIDGAFAQVQTALRLDPEFPDAICNFGDLMFETAQLSEAIAAYERAIAIRPVVAQYHMNLAFALLKAGDFARGWVEYEWRWKRPDFDVPGRHFPHPRWDGKPLNGRRILLHVEQGFGDTLQFIRYVPLVARLGGKILVQCQPQLHRLFQTIPAIDRLVRLGDPLPPFVVQCPIMSLPLALGTTMESIPANVPYVKPDPGLVQKFRAKFPSSPGVKKIGLAWAGSPGNSNNRNRSVPVWALAPLMNLPGVRIYSLQKGPGSGDLATLRSNYPHTEFIDCAPELNDFADTAAIIADLDLVIAVDSAVAHLAGALGKAVWVLLTMNADFRYLLNRDDCPWYPSMRLFRQTMRGDWSDPLQRIVQSLQTDGGVGNAD